MMQDGWLPHRGLDHPSQGRHSLFPRVLGCRVHKLLLLLTWRGLGRGLGRGPGRSFGSHCYARLSLGVPGA